jgi:pSer/pThr/pTyr-binding forkhead associated (FHA) protein
LDLGRQYLATTAEMRIGRKPENHIFLRDPKVSRYHAVVRINGSRLTLVDLESTNGTSVNEVIIHAEKRLFPGDRIKVGETVIQVVSQP